MPTTELLIPEIIDDPAHQTGHAGLRRGVDLVRHDLAPHGATQEETDTKPKDQGRDGKDSRNAEKDSQADIIACPQRRIVIRNFHAVSIYR